jgi:hypothetical protein
MEFRNKNLVFANINAECIDPYALVAKELCDCYILFIRKTMSENFRLKSNKDYPTRHDLTCSLHHAYFYRK